MNKEKELIDKLIDLAFAEDIGDGDHTTLSCIPATAMGKSKLLIKEAGVLAGIEVAKEIFNRFDPSMKVEVFINDGTDPLIPPWREFFPLFAANSYVFPFNSNFASPIRFATRPAIAPM